MITGYENGDNRYKIMQGEFSEQGCVALLRHTCEKLGREFRSELSDKDADVKLEVVSAKLSEDMVIEEQNSKKVICLLNSIPHGVQAMSSAMEGLVETSLNPGLLSTSNGQISIGISVRSSVESSKKALIGKLKSMAYLAGAQIEVTGDYPGWTYKKDSPLRDKMVEIYEEMYHEKPVIKAIHAGVECGLLAHKIPELDCVSIGPDMRNIHTADEGLCISSTERVWHYLLSLLEAL